MIKRITLLQSVKQSCILYILILIYLIFDFYNINKYPVFIDEATTYVDYVSKGFLHTICTYDEPNNHVFFSIILTFFNYLPINPLIAIRIPNMILGVCSILLLHNFLKKYFSFFATIISISFFTFSYSFVFYSIFARGYMMIIFCFLCSIILLEEMNETNFNKKNTLFCLISFLGFATIPIYLYVFTSLILIYAKKILSINEIRIKFIMGLILIGLSVLLFYTPIILNQSINSIINNKYTKTIDFKEIIDFLFVKRKFLNFYDKIFGINTILVIPILGLFIVFIILFNRRKKISNNLLFRMFLFLLFPFVFIVIHKVLPGARTWSYTLVPFSVILAIIIDFVFKNILKQALLYYLFIPIMILLQLIIFKRSHPNFAHRNDLISQNIVLKIQKYPCYRLNFEEGLRAYDLVVLKFMNLINEKKTKNCKDKHKEIFIGNYNKSQRQKFEKIIYYDKLSNKIVALTK